MRVKRMLGLVVGTWTAAVLIAVAIAWSSVALAAHYGTVCKHFNGPDGPKYVQQAKVCATIDDHDFEDKIRAWVGYHNAGTQRVTVHVSYIQLLHLRSGRVWMANVVNSFTYTVAPDSDLHVATPWRAHPTGTYYTRTRMWVCWPDLRGKPCGSAVAWNSRQMGYA